MDTKYENVKSHLMEVYNSLKDDSNASVILKLERGNLKNYFINEIIPDLLNYTKFNRSKLSLVPIRFPKDFILLYKEEIIQVCSEIIENSELANTNEQYANA